MIDQPVEVLEGEIAKLVAELSACYEELALLHQMTDRLRPFDDPERVARTVLQAVATTVRVRHAFMFIVEGQEPRPLAGTFLWVAADETTGARVVHGEGGREWPTHDGITRAALDSGSPLIVNDVTTDPRFRPYPIHIRSMMTVPLKSSAKSDNGVLGAINLADRLDGQDFTSGDLKLVATLAGLAGAALENALLVTDLQRVNAELAHANRRILEQRAAMIRSEKLSSLGRMAAGVAHELRNPLTVIAARAQLLGIAARDGRPPTADQLDRGLRIVEDQAERAVRIIAGLSTYAREHSPEFGPVSVPALVGDALELVRPQVKLDGVEVVTDLAPGLPLIRGNRDQLQQVLVNLFVNAAQAMPHNGRLTIMARKEATAGTIVVTVADTGVGIPPEHLTKIFDPFFTTKPDGEGTGLGLSIIQSIVEGHRGNIEVASEVGVGTTVTLEFPALQEEAA